MPPQELANVGPVCETQQAFKRASRALALKEKADHVSHSAELNRMARSHVKSVSDNTIAVLGDLSATIRGGDETAETAARCYNAITRNVLDGALTNCGTVPQGGPPADRAHVPAGPVAPVAPNATALDFTGKVSFMTFKGDRIHVAVHLRRFLLVCATEPCQQVDHVHPARDPP